MERTDPRIAADERGADQMIDAHYAAQKRGQMVSTLSIIAVMSLITAVLSATIPGHPAIAQDAAFDNERFF
ncbi:MAG: hypothetical protein V3R98_08840, partial [Alphaproteobacteria bacterium]